MNKDMEKLAGIEDGDSNEVCLAKTALKISELWDAPIDFGRTTLLNDLIHEGATYAGEVLNARDE